MAIHYYDQFDKAMGSRNFGDDINPFLLGRLLDPSIIASGDVCVVGIGTILNRRNSELISHYPKKVVFSSGAGYGQVTPDYDESWDFTCVRGPKTAEVLGLDPSLAICDGAVLLSDFFEPLQKDKRDGIVFIPHINTHFSAGRALKTISSELGWRYLTPDIPMDEFIDGVRSARLVVTEAMHGAILSDTMRVPWMPIAIHEHHDFKWQDWFMSIDEPYRCNEMAPVLWNSPKSIKGYLKKPYQRWKMNRLRERLASLPTSTPILSESTLLEQRKSGLWERVSYINDKYAG